MNTENETHAAVIEAMREHAESDRACATDAEDIYAVEANICDKFADRAEAAYRREVAELKKQLGNAAKLREAVKAVVDVGYPHNFQREAPHIRGYCYDITRAIDKCFAALAMPARNCDVYDKDDVRMAYHLHGDGLMTMQAVVNWLYATAKEGGAK